MSWKAGDSCNSFLFIRDCQFPILLLCWLCPCHYLKIRKLLVDNFKEGNGEGGEREEAGEGEGGEEEVLHLNERELCFS